jgi:hypothetical protein
MDVMIERLRLVVCVAGTVAMSLVAPGCGADEPKGKACSLDAACDGERICVEGECQAEWGSDAEVDGGDVDGGGCYVPEGDDAAGTCVREDCSGDVCETVACELGCEDWEQQSRCSCTTPDCSSSADCDSYACTSGTCGPCETDADCGEEDFCAADGKCVSDRPCSQDADCPARQECNDEGVCEDREECVVDDDCEGDQEQCLNGRCTYAPECESDSDCSDGMECIGERCYEAVCRGADDCEGDKVCNAGECIEPPTAESCFVATPNGQISENERLRLEAFARDSEGNGVPAEFEWNSSESSVASIADSGRHAVGGDSSGTTILTARLPDDTQCEGSVQLTNLGEVQDDELRVVVSDTNTNSPVSGAEVVLDNGATASTDGAGVATLDEPNGSYTISAFHEEYNYLTMRGLQSEDVRMPLTQKSGEGPTAGFTGQFDTSQINTSGDVTLGLAGTSINGGLLDLGLDNLLGPPFVNELQTPQGTQEIPLPSGMTAYGQVAGFDVDIKQTYYTTSPGGARLGWGLAGEVSGQRLFQLFQNDDNPLAVLLPLFNRFDHGTRPLQLSERPRVQDTTDIDGDGDTSEMVPDYMQFPAVDLQPSVRQNLVTEVSVTNFPSLPGGDAELAVLLGGNVLQSAGLVPLGISATTDENDDGRPDVRNLYMAPPHGSITGGRYAVAAMAFRTEGFDPSSGLELPDNLSVALWTRQSLPKEVGLGTFPDATAATVDTSSRTVEMTADAGPLYRFQFVGDGRTWEVWTTGPMGSMGSYQHTANIPQMPGSRTDLFTSGQKSMVDAVQARVTLNDLAEPTGVGLREVGLVATAFNRTVID